MIINIGSDYRLKSDELQWLLQRKLPEMTKAGKKRKQTTYDGWVTDGYYRDMSCALVAAAQRGVRAIEGTYPPEAVDPMLTRLDQIRDDIRGAINDLKKILPENV